MKKVSGCTLSPNKDIVLLQIIGLSSNQVFAEFFNTKMTQHSPEEILNEVKKQIEKLKSSNEKIGSVRTFKSIFPDLHWATIKNKFEWNFIGIVNSAI
jgi:hypothetical protein